MINLSYQKHLRSILTEGTGFAPRDMETIELLAFQFVYDTNYPVITIPERGIGYKAMLAEAHWILSGSNLLEDIQPWMQMKKYSNNGIHLDGAYGPAFVDQVSYVLKTLREDKASRRAVISIWRPRPFESNDIPCTLSLQFIIRNNKIYTIVNMRSSDAWLGLPYDCFTFAMMTRYIATCLVQQGHFVELGTTVINIGSAHLYVRNINEANSVIDADTDNCKRIFVPANFSCLSMLFLWLNNNMRMTYPSDVSDDMRLWMENYYG